MLFIGVASAPVAVAGQGRMPNILLIMADDLGFGDLGCYGNTVIHTPNLDKLATQGQLFTQFYAGSTVCAPSRASLFTGRHTGHTYIRGNGEVPLRPQDTTLASLLLAKGYTTAMVGKWGLGLPGNTGLPEQQGWQHFSGLLHHVESHYHRPDSAWKLINGKTEQIALPAGTYSNAWFTREAIRFLQHPKANPFFLYVAFTLPHAELVVPPSYLQAYLQPDGFSRFAPEAAHPPGNHYGPQPMPRAAYAAMVSQMDDYVGQLLHQLDSLGLAGNTLVIFTSDNGTHTEGGRTLTDAQNIHRSSGPLKGVKRDLYEGGIRIPLLLRWPAHAPAGGANHTLGAFWDLLPTLGHLAGVQHLPATDGVNLLPAFKGSKITKRPPLYWEFYEQGFKQAIRHGNYKLIRFFKNGIPAKVELYNLANDIGEQQNLASKKPTLVNKLTALMEKQRTPAENPLFQIK
ncbi:MAG TPA: arylsulfatase [Phnomibacter sp.]|nr:arylsulfatase [Phnomibacter sp.]